MDEKVIEKVSDSNTVLVVVASCESEEGVNTEAFAKELSLKQYPDIPLFQVYLPWNTGLETDLNSLIAKNSNTLDFPGLEQFLGGKEGLHGLIYMHRYVTTKMDEAVLPLTEAGFRKRAVEFGASAGMSVLIPVIGPPAYTFLRMMKRAVEMCVAAGLFSERAGHAFVDEVTALLKKGVWKKGEQPMMEAVSDIGVKQFGDMIYKLVIGVVIKEILS